MALLVIPFSALLLWFVYRLCRAATSARYGERDRLRFVAAFFVAALLAVILLIAWGIALLPPEALLR